MRALINLNDETGKDLFSVECEDDIGNWLDSFETLEEAEHFINARLMLHTHSTDFRDTRTASNPADKLGGRRTTTHWRVI